MLKRLLVRDFKSLRELDVEFGRLTVLVGANGCGKSSVLQAIKLVRDLVLDKPDFENSRFPAGALSQPLPGVAASSTFRVELQVDADTIEAELCAVPDEPNCVDWGASKVDVVGALSNLFDPIPPRLKTALRRVNLYQLDKRMMERPSYSEDANPTIGQQGEYLANVLDAMQGSDREEFQTIEEQLRQLVPGLRQIRLQRVKVPFTRSMVVNHEIHSVKDRVVGHQVLLDFEFARAVPADQASEGTMLLLGLLTIIGQGVAAPATVLLDDLDRALHPKAQRQLIEHLHQLLDQRPELQIIATSHSPYLVEHLAYDEVLAMTQSPVDGRSLIAPLAQHPDADRWRDEMSAGEFWSSVGEDWIHEAKAQ